MASPSDPAPEAPLHDAERSNRWSDSRPRLATLPPELRSLIFEFLEPKAPTLGDTRPPRFSQLDPEETWYDFLSRRRALWCLCLVSRGCCRLAQPLLYRVVALLSPEQMVLFFRTLTDRPAFGLWTGFFSCHLTLSDDLVVREFRRTLGRYLNTFRPVAAPAPIMMPIQRALDVMILSLPHIQTHAGDFNNVPQVILAFLLLFLDRVHTILLQVPITDDHAEYVALFVKIDTMERIIAHLKDAQTTRPDHTLDPVTDAVMLDASGSIPPLPCFLSLKSLLLQGDPELRLHWETDHADCCEIPEVWGAQPRQYWPLFRRCPNLATIEVCGDDGGFEDEAPDEDVPPPVELMINPLLDLFNVTSFGPALANSSNNTAPASSKRKKTSAATTHHSSAATASAADDPSQAEADTTTEASSSWVTAATTQTTSPESLADISLNTTLQYGGFPTNPCFNHIRHIYLHDSVACPRGLHAVLANAPHLETLYMTPRHDRAFYQGDFFLDDLLGADDYSDPNSLNEALMFHAKKLRHLDFAWLDARRFVPLIGPNGSLPALATLPCLQTLCIQLPVLFGQANWAFGELPTLAGLLPASLEELTLEEWWWRNYDYYEDLIAMGKQEAKGGRTGHWQEDGLYFPFSAVISGRSDGDEEHFNAGGAAHSHGSGRAAARPAYWNHRTRLEYYRNMAPYRATALAMLMDLAMACGRGDGDANGCRLPRLRRVSLLSKLPWTWSQENGGVSLDFHFTNVRDVFAMRGVEFVVDGEDWSAVG